MGLRHRLVVCAEAALFVSSLSLLWGCREPPEPWVDEREPCDDHNPARNLYWGDLHVHSSYSFDAWIDDVRVDPARAYRFAAGESVALPSLNDGGEGSRTLVLDRPLDFVAVTDHSEYLAEVEGCTTPGSAIYDFDNCVAFREAAPSAFVSFGIGLDGDQAEHPLALCGDGRLDCPAVAGEVWSRVQAAAEAAYDRTSACEMTTFIAYEWSGSRDLSNLHRNVIFRSSQVMATPLSRFEAQTPHNLLTRLEAECRGAIDGCDVISIPHNSNWSNGQMFIPDYPEGVAEEDAAALRADLEPLVEIFQHKGDSECINGLSGILGATDEFCDFEKLRTPPFDDCFDGTGTRGMVGSGCVSRLDYLRGVLLEGLREEQRLGVNPYLLGVIASTDT
ncbi:MAG TPA: DUF3604 domain-containing protein, partial [Nannocystis exedens]|nr:DUF3604 domain-containing protein [Nannocystis exedens]